MNNSEIKKIASLKQTKYRKESGLFTVEGNKLVQELINSRFNIDSITVTASWIEKNKNLAEKLPKYDIITSKQMTQISNMVTPPGILATAATPEYHIDSKDSEHEMLLMLDGINDPGNLGTIIRTADWFGINKIVTSEDTSEPWQPKVIQSSMGSIFRIKIMECDIVKFLNEVKTPVYGALMEGKDIYNTHIIGNKGVIIIGSESHGIRKNIMQNISCPVNIPRGNGRMTESLNASIAAGIIMSEIFRKNR
ncbi:MAG TPA: RNA methyltransferase [Bacteroidetes bacterium]|nr:RNA methyltransferase [Candidatus Limimorpha avicola]